MEHASSITQRKLDIQINHIPHGSNMEQFDLDGFLINQHNSRGRRASNEKSILTYTEDWHQSPEESALEYDEDNDWENLNYHHCSPDHIESSNGDHGNDDDCTHSGRRHWQPNQRFTLNCGLGRLRLGRNLVSHQSQESRSSSSSLAFSSRGLQPDGVYICLHDSLQCLQCLRCFNNLDSLGRPFPNRHSLKESSQTGMAEVIGVASGLVALATFALQSSQVLYQTIQSFQTQKKVIRELKEELVALKPVLESLKDLSDSDDPTFDVLKKPLYKCGEACKKFQDLIEKCAPRSNEDRKSFRDWIRIRWMGDDIDELKNMLAAYKSTIIIAVGDINLRTAVVTLKVLDEYRDLIAIAKSDLQDRRDTLDARLHSMPLQNNQTSDQDQDYRKQFQDERDSTTECLRLCEKVSLHIDQFRLTVWQAPGRNPAEIPPRSITTLNTLLSSPSRSTTAEVLTGCESLLKGQTNRLQSHLVDLDSQLQNLPLDPTMSQDLTVERQKMQDDFEDTKEALEICDEASERADSRRRNFYENVKIGEDNNHFIVSTVGDLISVKTLSTGARTNNLMGQMSDESLQTVAKSFPHINKTEPTHTQAGADVRFESHYGRGNPLRKGES